MSEANENRPELGATMNEDTKRTLVMAAATIAASTMSVMQTNEWDNQIDAVVQRAFKLVLDGYKTL